MALCVHNMYIFTNAVFSEEAVMAAPRPAKVAKVSPPIKSPPATAAPRPAKVSPPNKLQVLDERLRISTSKVRPVVSALHDVPIDLVAQSPGPHWRRHHPALVTLQQKT